MNPSLLVWLGASAIGGAPPDRPNVVIVISDDQGYGDLGLHGNPVVKTPHLDRLGREGVRIGSFYVSPVCSPTRSSLLTGRWTYRTGIVDTFRGRSMMHPDEITLAERLRDAGYATGAFGKWHLGDTPGQRPVDQGFDRSTVHRGGGLVQPAGPPDDSYFHAEVVRDGLPGPSRGYCSDVFTDEAIAFIRNQAGRRPFFAYLAFNAPHTPLQVDDAAWPPYVQALAGAKFPPFGRPVEGREDAETTARVYAMIENLDANVGRLRDVLEETGQAGRTLLVFLTDNGPQQPRWNAGLRGRKGTVFEGGIKVPSFWTWPGILPQGEKPGVAAHVDVVPTVLQACGLPPADRIDGVGLWDSLTQADRPLPSNRTLFVQWHRGDAPRRGFAFAVRTDRYKLVQPEAAREGQPFTWPDPPMLFDLAEDPFEQTDLAATRPELVADLQARYDAWFEDVRDDRWFAAPRIRLGDPRSSSTTLTRQDWRGMQAEWSPAGTGHWDVEVIGTGPYVMEARFPAVAEAAAVTIECGSRSWQAEVAPGASSASWRGVDLPAGPARIRALVLGRGESRRGVHYLEIRRESRRGP